MYRGKFLVKPNGKTASENNNIAYAAEQNNNPTPTKNSSRCGMMNWWTGGCGGWSGRWCAMMKWNTAPKKDIVPIVKIASAKQINITYTSAGLNPGNITVKKGQSYTITIDVKDTISGCMHMILIPWMDENAQALDAGNKVTFNITPKETGKFPFTCAMGVPHGYIIVE